MPEHEFITVEMLERILDEGELHPDREAYLNQVRRGSLYYNASDKWWIPVDNFEDMEVSEDQPTSRENTIYDTVNEVNSLLLKNRPTVRTHPVGHPELSDLSDDMDKVLFAAWRNAYTRHVVRSMQKESCICGLSVGKVGWNAACRRTGDGEVMIVKRAPAMCILDPFASNALRATDCRYIVDITRQTPEAIFYRYGTEGAAALGLRDVRGRKGSFSSFLKLLERKLVGMVRGESSDEDEKVDRRVDVYEFWLFPVPGRESELAIGEMVKEAKYPYGLVATMINREIVRVMANPFAKRKSVMMGEGIEAAKESVEVGHKLHPFVLLYWSREADTEGQNGIYSCKGMVQQQLPLQYDVNRLSRSIMANATTVANPGLDLIEDALEIPGSRITMPPGGILRINPKYVGRIDDVVRWHQGQQLPEYVYRFMMEKREAIKAAGGLKPGMVGLSPTGTSHTPEGTIFGMQQASFSRMWTPTDELDAALKDIAYRYLGLIQQYYKPGRWIDVSGRGESQYVEFQSKHIGTQFSLEVVSGTTTPLYDVQKDTKLGEIKDRVDAALATQNIHILESTRIFLVELDYPPAYSWVQLIERVIEELGQRQAGLQDLGATGLAMASQGGMLGAEAGAEASPGAPAAGGEEEGLRALAEELGVSEEDLIRVLSG